MLRQAKPLQPDLCRKSANPEGGSAEGGSAEQALADLRDSTASLKRLTARLESSEGLLGRLLNDPEYSDGLARDLESTLSDLAAITGKINGGEGTIGALINDRELYDGAEDVVSGVNDSKFARWLLRRQRKKGVKADEQAQQETDSP